MTLLEKKQSLSEDLAIIEDPHERLAYVIDRAKNEAALSDDLKIDIFKIEGCISNLWLVPEFKEGLCYFKSDADSSITKGVASLLCDLYSGHKPNEIIEIDPSFLGEVGITQHLTPNRRNGLSNLWNKIKEFVESCN
jgi:cysteine desulfuration protein SufE